MTADLELTQPEADTLDKCEMVIEKGIKTFVQVGKALLTIRDDRLYRTTYGTFEDYCQQRWQLARATAYQLVDAAQVDDALNAVDQPMSAIADIPKPANEAQARPLAKLLPKPTASPVERDQAKREVRDTWRAAVESAPRGPDGQPKVTAAHVAETVARRTAADVIDEQMRTPIGESNAELDEQLERVMEDSPSRFRANFSAAMSGAVKVMSFSPDRIIEVVDHNDVHQYIREWRRWCDDIEKRMKPGLRIVGGDR